MARFWTTPLFLLLVTVTYSHQTLTTEVTTGLENLEGSDVATTNVPIRDEVTSEPDTMEVIPGDDEMTKDKNSFGAKKTEFLNKINGKKHGFKDKKPSPYLIESMKLSSSTDSETELNNTSSVNVTNDEKVIIPFEVEDHLQTSESRQRSKIEIKEVNGTLYEYEYIYYYDDEYPLYDEDTPGGSNSSSTGSVTSSHKIPVTNAQSVPTSVNEVGVSDLRHKNENELQSVVDNEILSRGFGQPRHLDNIAEENNVDQLQIESGQLPTQTRFPPRSTTPPSEFTTDHNLKSFLLDQNANVLPGEGRRKTNTPGEKAAIDLYAFSRVEDKNFEESSTKTIELDFTTEPPNYFDTFYEYDITASDLEELGILTTSDGDGIAEFITTTKDIFHTEEPSTTTTSTTTTTTTTTPTTTTTTTTTTEEQSASRSRSFRGRNRPSPPGRGFIRQRGFTSNDITTDQSKEPAKNESDSSSSTSFPGRRRLGRPNFNDRRHLKDETKPMEDKVSSNTESETESPAKESPSLPTRGRFNRRKPPTLRNRNNVKVSTEATTDKQEKPIEEATESASKAPRLPLRGPNTRQRRPLGRNRFLNKLNVQSTPVQDSDSVDKTVTEQNETTGTAPEVASNNPEEVVEEPHVQPATTTEKNLRQNARKNHRFNIGNRRILRNRKGDRLPAPKTESAAAETGLEAVAEEQSASGTQTNGEDIAVAEHNVEETPAEPANPLVRGNFRRRNNRKNAGRLNHRFNNKQETSKTPESQNAESLTPVSDNPVSDLTVDQHTEEDAGRSDPQVGADQESTFSRPLNRAITRKNRFQNRRKQTSSLLPSLISSSQTESTPENREAIIEEPPVEPLANSEVSVSGDSEQPPSPDQPAEEHVTEIIEAETTTEKLTRRQLLARRRNRFLHTG